MRPEPWRNRDRAWDMQENLRHWRERAGLTVEGVGLRLAVNVRSMRRLLSGDRELSLEQVQTLTEVLGLSWTEAKLLHYRSGHPMPPPPPSEAEVPDVLLEMMHVLPYAAMIEAPDYLLLAANDYAFRDFPWFVPGETNVLESLLVGPGRERLADAEEVWIPLLVGLIKATILESERFLPQDRAGLFALADSIRRDPVIDEVFSQGDLQDRTYGVPRAMRLGSDQEATLLHVISLPLDQHPEVTAGVRMVFTKPVDGRPEPPLAPGFHRQRPPREA